MKTALDRPSCVHMGVPPVPFAFCSTHTSFGYTRQPTHTLHWNRRPKRSSGEAHSTKLSKPRHGPQKATDFGHRTVHEARQNHHSGCSMLIGCDAHNQNTFRDPKKQKPPRPEAGCDVTGLPQNSISVRLPREDYS